MYTVLIVFLTVFFIMRFEAIMSLLKIVALSIVLLFVKIFGKDKNNEESEKPRKKIGEYLLVKVICIPIAVAAYLTTVGSLVIIISEFFKWFKGV